jgi:MFS family permease
MNRTGRGTLDRNKTGRVVPPQTQAKTGAAPAATPIVPDSAGVDAANGLISRIQAKRAEVNRYLRATGTRRRRLVNLTIVAGSIATALTAAPALGGKPLADWLTETFALSSPSWRILCAVAAVCSLAAAVATQLHTSKNYEEHIARAQGIGATLEMLEVAIASDHLSRREATSQYLKCVENTSFIEAVQ